MKHYIGEIIDEVKIIDIVSKSSYLVQCLKCNRIRKVGSYFIESRKRTFHKFCIPDFDKSIPENKRFYQSYYNLNKDLLKKANIKGFVDFYDKFYMTYIENLKKYPNKIFFLKEINGEYQYVVDDFHEYYIGEVIDDIIIIDFIPPDNEIYYDKRFRIKCLKCNREYIVTRSQLRLRTCTKHDTCMISRADRVKEDESFKRFHSIWLNMKDRTNNNKSKSYKWYGARGIKSDEFTLFIDFYDLMYQSYLNAKEKWPNEVISLDRINSDGDYSYKNCRWIPKKFQNGNTCTNHWIKAKFNNQELITKNISNFAAVMKVSSSEIFSYLKGKRKSSYKGWTFEYIDINDYKDIPFINDINAIIDITDINNPININPI